ncbi:MAG TPA: phosphotransferase, partial [Caulobacteraceae bacterium]
VAAPIAPPREFDGAMWFLMPWMRGRAIGRAPRIDADYEQVGALLAEVHAATAALPPPPQRPGWGSYCDAALPLAGGAERRRQLLSELAKVDADVAMRFARAADALEARDLPGRFAQASRQTIHADFAP